MIQLQYECYNISLDDPTTTRTLYNIWRYFNYNTNTTIYLDDPTTIRILQYLLMFQLQQEYYNISRSSYYNTNTAIYLDVPTTIWILQYI